MRGMKKVGGWQKEGEPAESSADHNAPNNGRQALAAITPSCCSPVPSRASKKHWGHDGEFPRPTVATGGAVWYRMAEKVHHSTYYYSRYRLPPYCRALRTCTVWIPALLVRTYQVLPLPYRQNHWYCYCTSCKVLCTTTVLKYIIRSTSLWPAHRFPVLSQRRTPPLRVDDDRCPKLPTAARSGGGEERKGERGGNMGRMEREREKERGRSDNRAAAKWP